MSKFLPTDGFKWIDPKEFDWSKYISNSSEGYVSEVHLAYPNELHKIHNDFPLAPDKIEVKVKMLPSYQLKIADLYNIPIDNVKLTFFNKEKYVLHYENFQLFESRFKTKKKPSRIRIQSITVSKAICQTQPTKRNRSRKKWWQGWKSIKAQINE